MNVELERINYRRMNIYECEVFFALKQDEKKN